MLGKEALLNNDNSKKALTLSTKHFLILKVLRTTKCFSKCLVFHIA